MKINIGEKFKYSKPEEPLIIHLGKNDSDEENSPDQLAKRTLLNEHNAVSNTCSNSTINTIPAISISENIPIPDSIVNSNVSSL